MPLELLSHRPDCDWKVAKYCRRSPQLVYNLCISISTSWIECLSSVTSGSTASEPKKEQPQSIRIPLLELVNSWVILLDVAWHSPACSHQSPYVHKVIYFQRLRDAHLLVRSYWRQRMSHIVQNSKILVKEYFVSPTEKNSLTRSYTYDINLWNLPEWFLYLQMSQAMQRLTVCIAKDILFIHGKTRSLK